MPGPLDALERFMEEAVEGTVQRVFRPALQPVQLAKAAARRMEEQQIIGPSGPQVPNSYSIALHPRDFERFARFQQALQGQLEQYLLRYARDRDWQPVSRLEVRLLADSAVRAGRPRVTAQLADLAVNGAPDAAIGGPPIERTTRQPRLKDARRPDARRPGDARPASLMAETGERFALARPVTTIGRALENDVVIADTRISRFHAEVHLEAGRAWLRDLGSTNGTQVANRAGVDAELHDGDTIALGGFRLTFRQS